MSGNKLPVVGWFAAALVGAVVVAVVRTPLSLGRVSSPPSVAVVPALTVQELVEEGPELVLEAREARMAAVTLADENESLRQKVEVLGEQVRELTVSLASARMEVDVLKARSDREELALGARRLGADGVLPRELRLVDVNPDLRMVVLDAGRARGMKPGMVFSVVRDGRMVARVRTVDVREDIAGAVVEETDGDRFPVSGDRLLPWRSGGTEGSG